MAESSFPMLPGGNVRSDRDAIVADLEGCDVLAGAGAAREEPGGAPDAFRGARRDGFFASVDMTPELARYLAEVDYVDHFVWVAVDSADVPMGSAAYVRSASDRALADIAFLIRDEFQGRGLGTLLMGALAVAARRNGISRFCADVLAENGPMRAVLAHASITWEPPKAGVVHGYAAVPDPGAFGITPGTAAALAAVVDELKIACSPGSAQIRAPGIAPTPALPGAPRPVRGKRSSC